MPVRYSVDTLGLIYVSYGRKYVALRQQAGINGYVARMMNLKAGFKTEMRI